jgi:hypothetical protein
MLIKERSGGTAIPRTTAKELGVPMQKQDTAIRDRALRGTALFRAGAVEAHGDVFTVKGTARHYTVSLPEDGDPRCDCPDFAKRRETCKHGYAVVIFASRDRCRRAKTATPKTGRRHDGLKGILADMGKLDRTATGLGV